ncbi:MAG: type II secretion system protein [Planctomycetota bacterium]
MRTATRRWTGFTLIELLVVVAIIALLVSILLPSLGRAKDLAMTIVCSARHQGAYKGFGYYGTQFDGVWIAPWDISEDHDWTKQWPYTMVLYAAGETIPNGEDVHEPGHPEGPWYGTHGRHGYPPTFCESTEEGKQLQCPVVAAKPPETGWHDITTMSMFIMGASRDANSGGWRYRLQDYPKPDLMTHPSTTGLIMCQAGLESEGQWNAWVHYTRNGVVNFISRDPHMGESNVTFCDGHTETLGRSDLYETMWMSMWERGEQVDHEPLE